MNREDNKAIENDLKKVNLELFGVQYPFCSSSEATHSKKTVDRNK